MRKQQQLQLLELLKTIREAQAAGLYADCQDGAFGLCDFINSLEGEGTSTVALLAEYCEMLFNASNGDIGEGALQKKITQIENSVKYELKTNTIEMVFLSYKASMSDSLESIYLAAKADRNCDAYWIPIPYYERNADGSVRTMRYEGADCYGLHLECTDWQAYDLETRRPDVIFTFNPYDAGNFVTSVHPNFYCKRLRNLTSCLIYVPYFVATSDVAEHFCTTAGCIFAHKVILQSEKIRDTYIRVFRKEFGNSFGRPKDKFLALGSPKFDKVVNTKREDCELPAEWQNVISGKKVIFYNTTIAPILAGNEQYLEKVRYVFNVFRTRNDVVLWWRPHPLSANTCASMRPQLLREYVGLVDSYKQEGWGIYDDTPDLHRALAYTDAYYGDRSSLVPMFQAAGKAVIIQAPKVPGNESTANAMIGFCLKRGNSLWYAAEACNALFRVDTETWQAEYVGSFPHESTPSLLYEKPVLHKERLFFPPINAKEIGVYSLSDQTFTKIPYPVSLTGNHRYRAFFGAVGYEEYVYFTPFEYPAIMRLNTSTGELKFYDEWIAPLGKLMGDVKSPFFPPPTIVGDSIMLAAYEANAVVEFNMATQQSVVHEVGQKRFRYNGICFDGENYWLSPRKAFPVVKWNPQTGETREFSDLLDPNKDIINPFAPIIYCNGFVWLLPRFAEQAFMIDVHSGSVSIATPFRLEVQDSATKSKVTYGLSYVSENSIWAYRKDKGTLIEYNCETKKCREEAIKYPQDAMGSLLADNFIVTPEAIEKLEDCLYCEGNGVNLQAFIAHLVSRGDSAEVAAMTKRRAELAQTGNMHMDGTAGQAIYEFAKLQA